MPTHSSGSWVGFNTCFFRIVSFIRLKDMIPPEAKYLSFLYVFRYDILGMDLVLYKYLIFFMLARLLSARIYLGCTKKHVNTEGSSFR